MNKKDYEHYRSKTIIGLTEKVVVKGRNGTDKEMVARIDTGATKSSIDARIARELSLGPIVETKMIKSAHGNSLRPVIKVTLELGDKRIISKFTIADRTHMNYKILIGQNTLKDNFLIDPSIK